MLLIVQSPFLHVERGGDATSIRYAPDMEWRSEFGAFPSDRALIAPYRLELPALRPGQFRGLFAENLETEYTTIIAR